MVNYYQFDVISDNGNTLIYPIDAQKIFGIKYEWIPENTGIAGVKHATAVCMSDEVADESAATKITKSVYDSFAQITATTNGNTITVTTPAAKGTITFLIDGKPKVVPVSTDKKAILQNATGVVRITSNVWSTKNEVIINEI